MQTPLLQTKLYIPPARNKLVNRPRLIKRLNDGLNYKLTLISAPAGFGKTTLVNSWLYSLGVHKVRQAEQGRKQIQVGWVSLDERDNEATLFWHYVIAALQTIVPTIGITVQSFLESSTTFSHEILVTMLINEVVEHLQINDESLPVLLILDDYHLITNPDIHAGLNFLLDHLPPFLHLVITTRADPPLRLSYRHGRSEVNQIRAADLSFNNEEVVEFLNAQMGLGLSQKDINILENRTEGWVAGLQLAAISLQDQPDRHTFVTDFAGDDRYIADYLVDQVLYFQPPHIQTFLLQTSILNQLCGPLCKALTGQEESQTILNQLEQYNLFLTPLDNRREWYRYHSLFADLLRQRLRESSDVGELSKLHLQASEWYETSGEVIEAVDHAILGGDHSRAAQIIERRSEEIFKLFKLNTLAKWIQAFPQSIIESRPVLSMIYAWALLATGKFSETEICLQSIEDTIGVSTEDINNLAIETLDPKIRGALLEVLVLRSVIAINQFDIPKTLKLCQMIEPYLKDNAQPHLFNPALSLRTVVLFNLGLAHELSGEGKAAEAVFEEAVSLSLAQKNIHILPMAVSHLGQLQVLQGYLHQAEKTYQKALKLGAEITGKHSPVAGIAEIGLGYLYYEWNDLERSANHIQAGIELAKQWNHSENLMMGYLGLARLEKAHDSPAGASILLQEVEDILMENGALMLIPVVNAFRARLWVSEGKLAEAENWLNTANLHLDSVLNYLQENDFITFARLLIAQKKWDEAKKLIARLLEFAGLAERNARVIELMLLRAIVMQGQGQTNQAEEVLSRTLKMAEPEGYIRLFVDEGPTIAQLLYNTLAQEKNSGYAELLLKSFKTQDLRRGEKEKIEAVSDQLLIEPLSAREIEVLQCVVDGLSNREIALKLSISLSTVKTHTRNIYGKLDVNSRTQAIAQSIAWGIIPRS